jgi:hypothetical protein
MRGARRGSAQLTVARGLCPFAQPEACSLVPSRLCYSALKEIDMRRRTHSFAAVVLAVLACLVVSRRADRSESNWPAYSATNGAKKYYRTRSERTSGNVKNLRNREAAVVLCSGNLRKV